MILYSCESGDYVAKVGNLKVSRQEYIKALETRYSKKENYQDLSYESKQEILNMLIDRSLKLNDAYDRNLDKDSSVVAEMKKYRERLMGSRYYEKQIIDQIITKENLNKYIENQKTEVNASHILITHSDANPKITRSISEAKQLVDELLKKIENGAALDSLAVIYSDDPSAKQARGSLGWFTWGAMVSVFQEAVWTMEIGTITGPVETKYGYHIIKLDDRRNNKQFSAPETIEDFYYVKRKLLQAYGDSARVLWDQYREELTGKYNLTILKPEVMKLSALITEKMNAGQLNLQSFTPEENTAALAKWDGGSISLTTLIERNRERTSRALLNYKQVSVLETDVKNVSIIEIVIQDAIREGLSEDEFVVAQAKKFRDDKLLQMIDDVAVDRDVIISDEEARQYYDENPRKFVKPAEIELREIFVKEKKLAYEIIIKLGRGARFDLLAQKYSEDKATAAKDGYVGFRSSTARGAVSRHAFQTGPGGQIGGPVKYRKGWVIYKTGEMRDESIRRFKDVKNRAKSLLRRERLKQKRVEWKKELDEKYSVTVNEAMVKSI
jgi:parvulin-like peptidyl-prolyl isomerase